MKKNEFVPVDEIIKAVRKKKPKTQRGVKTRVKKTCNNRGYSMPTQTFLDVLWDYLYGSKK